MKLKECHLRDIKGWLNSGSMVELPAIQRGFVWKPYQMECLWDSVFREYPIGSFLLTNTGNSLMLIDGQQRATTIALGYYNPWHSDLSRLGNATNLPVIWMDVSDDDNVPITENCKYVFRVVTRSHPWGYQLNNNRNKLCISDRIKSASRLKGFFGVDMYTKLRPSERLPFDARLPIPLCFLLNSLEATDNYEAWKKEVINKCLVIPALYRPKFLPDNETFFSKLSSCDLTALYQNLVRLNECYIIPAITVDNKLILDDNDKAEVNPTLFVRLNSFGTPLEGEELIYSIYKAVCPATKNLVESIACNIIQPSRIITLSSRLVLSNRNHRFYNGISLIQFQREISKDDFKKALENLIGMDSNSSLKSLVDKAIAILKYDGIPDTIVKVFIKESPDGFLLLLNWLQNNPDKELTFDLKAQICSRLYTNYWFGNLSHLVSILWGESDRDDFWSTQYHNVQKQLVSPNSLEDFLLKKAELGIDYSISPEDPIWEEWTSREPRSESLPEEDYIVRMKDEWNDFLNRLLKNKYLVLLAQREYINRTFKDFNQVEDLQDTETPWDWDHIYPESWVYYQQNIDVRTRYWEWRIGNFRAMSLTDNRSENNNLSPAERFETINADYYIKANDLVSWKKLTANHRYIKDSDPEFVMIHAKAIIIRSVNIYRNMYDMFAKYLK